MMECIDNNPSVKRRKVEPTYSKSDNDEKKKTSYDLRSLIDTQVTNLNEPWKGSIPFWCLVYFGDEKELTALVDAKFENIDICNYLCGQILSAKRLYFDPKK